MRDFIPGTARLSIIAGAALLVAGCGGSESATNVANDLGDNLLFEEPANDASAMESAMNASGDLVPIDNAANVLDEPETSGGDTGGNSLENNVTGM